MVAIRNKQSRGPPRGPKIIYGYTKKSEYFPVVYENNCQNESIKTKPFDSNGHKNLFRYILYLTVMVAFSNKWVGGPPRDPNIWIDPEMGRFSCGLREPMSK